VRMESNGVSRPMIARSNFTDPLARARRYQGYEAEQSRLKTSARELGEAVRIDGRPEVACGMVGNCARHSISGLLKTAAAGCPQRIVRLPNHGRLAGTRSGQEFNGAARSCAA